MSEDKDKAPRCSQGAIIGANYTIEDAERDALLPPQRINWNIRRNGEEGPTMAYVREDVHNAALATVRREEKIATLRHAIEVADELEYQLPQFQHMQGAEAVRKRLQVELAALERAADSREGGDDEVI